MSAPLQPAHHRHAHSNSSSSSTNNNSANTRSGKENTTYSHQQPLPPPPSSSAAPKYAHPHSPQPTHLSQFTSVFTASGATDLLPPLPPPPPPSSTSNSKSVLSHSPRLDQSYSHHLNHNDLTASICSTQTAFTSYLHSPPPAPLSPALSSYSAHSPTFHDQFYSSSASSASSASSSSAHQQQYQQSTSSRPTAPLNTYHRPIGPAEPTIDQLLAQQPRSGGGGGGGYGANGKRNDRDVTMANATGVVSWRKGQGFKEWEKVKLNSLEVKRKADVAQLFFYDHYFDLLTYLHARKERLATFKDSVASRNIPIEQSQSEWSSYKGRERVLLRKRRTKLKLDQFHILTQVGQGGYGEVYLARHKETQLVVALKKMRKRTLLKMDEIRHVLTERDILASTNSPWLVRLLYAFQDPTHVYLAMDFIAGGDFRTLLNNSGVLKEEHARFYISEMFCSVAELHKLGYIHRDLKPENFLIDPSGHIKLTDFGLAAGALNPGKIENLKHKLDEVKDRELIYRTTVEMKSIYKSIRMSDPRYADSVVGSPDYMAIETLRGSSYTFSVDYWSLGCILFEFLAGFPPFSGATSDETWANLKNWQKCLRRPHYDRPEDRIFNLSDVGWSAITALITTKEKRLSTLDAVKAHPFFAGVPWATLRDSKAPFIPALDSEVDSGYFDDFTSEADMKKYAEVREKQANVDRVREKEDKFGRGVWVGFTFKAKKEEPAEFLEGDDELVVLF